MSEQTLEKVLEVVLLAAGRPMKVDELLELLADSPLNSDRSTIRETLKAVGEQWADRGMELSEVASGYRLQVNAEYSPWIARLQAERPARYSRALLETLALIAYRQPITRGEIEDVRGVSVSASIIRTLLERDWIRVLGQRDVPGRPSIYGTTRVFLDDFNLKGLEDLPPLADVRDIDKFHADLFAEQVDEARTQRSDGDEPVDADATVSGSDAAPSESGFEAKPASEPELTSQPESASQPEPASEPESASEIEPVSESGQGRGSDGEDMTDHLDSLENAAGLSAPPVGDSGVASPDEAMPDRTEADVDSTDAQERER